MKGIMQLTFQATEREALPILPFGAEVEVQIGDHEFRAFISKATYRDKTQGGMHQKSGSDEVHYTLEVQGPEEKQ